ncbi:MAG: hypothetical protein RLY86_1871 [Pseudomonadota bacterium]|jgi:hypothetical protein
MVRGGYPEIRTLEGQDPADRYTSYLESIVECELCRSRATLKGDSNGFPPYTLSP